MKYKRQIMNSMFAIALLASTTSVFAENMPATSTKVTQGYEQVKMKSRSPNKVVEAKGKDREVKDKNGKDVEAKDDTNKKVKSTKKHEKSHVKKMTRTTASTTNPI